jgi:hypothetical protein
MQPGREGGCLLWCVGTPNLHPFCAHAAHTVESAPHVFEGCSGLVWKLQIAGVGQSLRSRF